MNNLYQLYCDNCHYKKITDGVNIDDLIQVKKSKLQKDMPKLDPSTNKTIKPLFKEQKKTFKCPKCGFSIRARKIKTEEAVSEQKEETTEELKDKFF
jgi:predicted RNA-binding Zn-ribbon protein involved in translation (DUF1610 family)